jgi:hypothetical protein
MVNINIEIPEELHKKLKFSSAVKDQTLKDHIVEILENKSKEIKTRL